MNDLLPVNFTISHDALAEAERIKAEYNATANDPFDVLTVAWGLYQMNDGKRFENVIISFYPQSFRSSIEPIIQSVAGTPVVFFTTSEYHSRFAGKIVDHRSDRGFFLR